jgi:hypothetical protein
VLDFSTLNSIIGQKFDELVRRVVGKDNEYEE